MFKHLGSRGTVRKMGGWIVVDVFTNNMSNEKKGGGAINLHLEPKKQLKFEAA